MSQFQPNNQYKNLYIFLDIEKGRYKNLSDDVWRALPGAKCIVLTQVKMTQGRGGMGAMGAAARITNSYNAFSVYIKAGNRNIMAFRGKRKEVEKEAAKLSIYFNVPIKDLIPRNADGSIIDDDSGFWSVGKIVVLMLITLLLVVIKYGKD